MSLNKEHSKMKLKTSALVSKIIGAIEILLAAILVVVVLISAFFTVMDLLGNPDKLKQLANYQEFQALLSYLFLLIIALELALMLIKHCTNSVVDIIIYAIARKMLMYNSVPLDILLTVLSLLVLFLIKSYLLHDSSVFKPFDFSGKEKRAVNDMVVQKDTEEGSNSSEK